MLRILIALLPMSVFGRCIRLATAPQLPIAPLATQRLASLQQLRLFSSSRRGTAMMAQGEPAEPADVDELMKDRLAKAEKLRADGGEPFAYSYDPTHTATELAEQWAELENGAEDETADVAVSGRLMLKRNFGKLAFITLQDKSGTIQLYLEKKRLTDRFTAFLSSCDAGDIIGARGTLKRTDKGELSVYAHEVSMLTKALRPLPDKWAGLKDIDKRYRQRYLDLISNPPVRQTFADRARIVSHIRRTLDERGYLEIETPALIQVASGAEARPTAHRNLAPQISLPSFASSLTRRISSRRFQSDLRALWPVCRLAHSRRFITRLGCRSLCESPPNSISNGSSSEVSTASTSWGASSVTRGSQRATTPSSPPSSFTRQE